MSRAAMTPTMREFTAAEWAAGLRLAIQTTPEHSPYVWVNPDAAEALADFLSDLARRERDNNGT